jgi:VIT1/CCC1 family predicted Fe2+/Mn2+ transporter
LLGKERFMVFPKTMTKPTAKNMNQQIVQAEFQRQTMAARLNWLRAGVLGANDGIMSTSGLVLGVAAAPGATASSILIAGTAAVVAGSISMAGGEYTSVSAQRDSEKARRASRA